MKLTCTCCVAACERLTVKTAFTEPVFPSVTVASEMLRVGTGGGEPSFWIVTTPWVSEMGAPDGPDRLTTKVSLGSNVVSPRIGTSRVADVWPTANVTLSDWAV